MQFDMKRSMWFFGLLLAVAGLSSFRTADIAVSRPDRAQRRSLAKLERSYEYIRKMYVDSVDMAPLVEEAIRGMLTRLDPHSAYLSEEERKGVDESFDGSFGGIGIEFNVLNDTVVIVNTIAGGPSAQVGLLPGDRIVGIDGQRAVGLRCPNDCAARRARR